MCKWGESSLHLVRDNWRDIKKIKCVWGVKAISAHLRHILLGSRYQMFRLWTHSPFLLLPLSRPCCGLHVSSSVLNSQVLIFTSGFQASVLWSGSWVQSVGAGEPRWQELMPSLILHRVTNICPLGALCDFVEVHCYRQKLVQLILNQ